MPRSEPNIFSQKWGKGCDGALASISTASASVCECAAVCARKRPPTRTATAPKKRSATRVEFFPEVRWAIRRLLKIGERCRGARHGGRPWERAESEAEARLEFDDAASQATGRLAELSIFDCGLVRAENNRLKVELVEGVEEVAAQLEFRAFAEELQAGQTELLRQAEIEAKVVGSAEGVAADARRTLSANVEIRRTLERAVGWSTVAVADDAWEIKIGCEEGAVGSVPRGLYQQGRRPSGTDGVGAGNGHGSDLACDWRPRKARVGAHDGVDLPTADDFADPIGARAVDGEIPQCACREGVLGVEIRWSVLVLRTRRIGLVGLRAGTFVGKLVDALAVSIVEVKQEAPIKLAAQAHVQRVVIRIDVAGRNEDGKESWIGRLEEILVNKAREFVPCAALIAGGGDETPRQTALDVKGIQVDVGVAEFGSAAIKLDGLISGASGVGADSAILGIDSETESWIHGIAGCGIAAPEHIGNDTTVEGRAEVLSRSAAANVKAGKCRGIAARVGEEDVVGAIVGDAEAAANDGAVAESRWAPCKAQAGAEIVAIGLDQRVGKSDLGIDENAGRNGDVRKLALGVAEGRVIFVAQTQIHGEI